MSESFPEFKINKGLVGSIVLLIIVVVFLFKSAVTINAGESGVLFKTFGGGVETDAPALGEGFHIIAPWNSVFVYKVRQQSISAEMNSGNCLNSFPYFSSVCVASEVALINAIFKAANLA